MTEYRPEQAKRKDHPGMGAKGTVRADTWGKSQRSSVQRERPGAECHRVPYPINQGTCYVPGDALP